MENKRETFLKESLERANYWLQYAETKNGVLLGFESAAIAFLFSSSFSNGTFLPLLPIPIFVVALVISIFSLYPKDGKKENKEEKEKKKTVKAETQKETEEKNR